MRNVIFILTLFVLLSQVSFAQWFDPSSPYRSNVTVYEGGYVDRINEIVDVKVNTDNNSFNCKREFRVYSSSGQQLVSQVYNESYSGSRSTRRCRSANVVFETNISRGETKKYEVYYGNVNATTPSYPTDLRITNDANNIILNNSKAYYRLRRLSNGELGSLSAKDAVSKLNGINQLSSGYWDSLDADEDVAGSWNYRILDSGPVFVRISANGSTDNGIGSKIIWFFSKRQEIKSVWDGAFSSIDNAWTEGLDYGGVAGGSNDNNDELWTDNVSRGNIPWSSGFVGIRSAAWWDRSSQQGFGVVLGHESGNVRAGNIPNQLIRIEAGDLAMPLEMRYSVLDSSFSPTDLYNLRISIDHPLIINGVVINNTKTKKIIVRSDDAAAFWPGIDLTFPNITNTLIQNGIPHTIAVIPYPDGTDRISSDQNFRNYMLSIKNSPYVEIAMHGYTHMENEFLNLNRQQTNSRLQSGINIFRQDLNVTPTTFVPPFNAFNRSNLASYTGKGFNVFSADLADSDNWKENPRGLLHLPVTAQGFYDYQFNRTMSLQELTDSCQFYLTTRDTCIVMIHHEEFTDDGVTINQTNYAKFLGLIQWIKQQEINGIVLTTLKGYRGS